MGKAVDRVKAICANLSLQGEFIFVPREDDPLGGLPCYFYKEKDRRTCASQSMDTMNQQLDASNIVGISYLFSFMKNSYDYNFSSRHASTVVGRNYNEKTGDCEYLVRNSWGANCDSYDSKFVCHDGHVLVPEYALERALGGVGYMKLPEKANDEKKVKTIAQ